MKHILKALLFVAIPAFLVLAVQPASAAQGHHHRHHGRRGHAGAHHHSHHGAAARHQ